VTIYLSTLNLQQVRGLDPLMAGLAFLGPSAASLAALALAGGWVVSVIALTACGFTMGLVYAFTTVATQAVVRPERAGEAAGVALTSLVTLAGVGVAVSGTMLEVLRHGVSEGRGIGLILGALAALLLPAGVCVMAMTRARISE
jgi:hypothetical protein